MSRLESRDVGKVLLGVKEEVGALRRRVAARDDTEDLKTVVKDLDSSIEKIENHLVEKLEALLSNVSSAPAQSSPAVPPLTFVPRRQTFARAQTQRDRARVHEQQRALSYYDAPLSARSDKYFQTRFHFAPTPPATRREASNLHGRVLVGSAVLHGDRRLIPLPPLASTPLRPQPADKKFVRAFPATGHENSSLKFDLLTERGPRYVAPPERLPLNMRPPRVASSRPSTTSDADQTPRGADPMLERNNSQAVQTNGNVTVHTTVDPRGFSTLMDNYSLHHILISKGSIVTSTPEYASFVRVVQSHWGPISQILVAFENIMQHFAVPIAWVDGKAVERLVLSSGLSALPMDTMLECIVNKSEVFPLLRRAGQRYVGIDGRAAAASKIKATFKMWKCRCQYIEFLHFLRSVVTIQRAWRRRLVLTVTRRLINEHWLKRLDAFELLAQALTSEWASLKGRRRVVVHLPSIAYTAKSRPSSEEALIQQGLEVGRLCDLLEEGVSVVLVSPFPLSPDLLTYYARLLRIDGNSTELLMRLKIVTPEFADSRLPLALRLLASKDAMRRLHTLVRGHAGFIVPHRVTRYEIHVATEIRLPLYAGRDRSILVSFGKSWARTIGRAASLPVLPGEENITSEAQLYNTLAELIVSNLGVTRWIIKLNHSRAGRSVATYDCEQLQCYDKLVREREKYPDLWNDSGTHHNARRRVLAELPDDLEQHVAIVGFGASVRWRQFVSVLSEEGGAIEAWSPNSLGTVAVDVEIEPSGNTSVVSMSEISADSHHSSTIMTPQTACDPSHLQTAALQIGGVLFAQAVFGFVHIKFLVNHTGALSPINIKPGLSQILAAVKLAECLSGPSSEQPRHIIIAPLWLHAELPSMPFSALLGLCHSLGIRFSHLEREGTVLVPTNEPTRTTLFVISMAKSREAVGNLVVAHFKSMLAELPVNERNNVMQLVTIVRRHLQLPR